MCGIVIGFAAVALVALTVSPALARGTGRIVRYHGYPLRVPSSWQVIDLARAPHACVRFNRHALYLGVPSARQNCPAHAVGRTEAILLEPIRAVAASGSRGAIIRGRGSAASISIRSAGLVATTTWSRQRRLISTILGRRVSAARSPPAAHSARAAKQSRDLAVAHSAQAVYTGLGFDSCATPSSNAMSAWSSSPYRAVGIYLGGANSACSQPNLTSGWVGAEVAAGWHLIPTYVGLQGRGACGGRCSTINSVRASSQGVAAARDAVDQAHALGIPAGNPIYNDIEAYDATSANSAAVLSFLSGWTKQLHAEGYLSGVYSSAGSGIGALVRAAATPYAEPDDIWIADWNGARTTKDGFVPAFDWPNHQRLHQYRGGHNETYGGVRINIDNDYLAGATADTSSPIPDNTFVEVSGTGQVYRIAGGAPLFVSSWDGFGGPQPVQLLSQKKFLRLPRYPADGTFLTTTTGLVYRIAGGAPILVTEWALFGTVQPSITVDEWELQNLTNPLAHLRPVPLNGTVVEGLPSQTYWSFKGGVRQAARLNAAAVAVDDQGLAVFPEAAGALSPLAQTSIRCVVPRLERLILVKARAALTRAHCRLGTVIRPRHWPAHHPLRVLTQSAAPHSKHRANFRVGLRLSLL